MQDGRRVVKDLIHAEEHLEEAARRLSEVNDRIAATSTSIALAWGIIKNARRHESGSKRRSDTG